MHKLGKASGFHAFVGATIVFTPHAAARAESSRQNTLIEGNGSAEAGNYINSQKHDAKFRQLFGNWQAMERASTPQVSSVVVRSGNPRGQPVYPVRKDISGSSAVVSLSTARPAAQAFAPAPANGRRQVATGALTSGFGMRRHPILGGYRAHSGIDLAAPMGTPIVATANGVVQIAGWKGGYGNLVELDHGGGLQTRYGHMSQVNVAEGQRVRKGDIIGLVGSTGRSTGPHVHYEVRVNGQAVDPLTWNR